MRKVSYDDLLNLPYPNPEIEQAFPDQVLHAAQFAPFAALTGYGEAVEETARDTECKVELDEYQKADLNQRLQCLCRTADTTPVRITYFVSDDKKPGGAYITQQGIVRRIKAFEKLVVMEDGTEIPIADIVEIEGRFCNDMEDVSNEW